MTPTEAELAIGEASATITRALSLLLTASYYEPGHGPTDEVGDIWRAAAADASRARDALMARIRELESERAKLKRNDGALNRQVDCQRARAEAAEKRAAELEAEVAEGTRRIMLDGFKLATLRATPTAALREALAELHGAAAGLSWDAIEGRLIRDGRLMEFYVGKRSMELLRAAMAKAETALKATEAGEGEKR